MDRKRLGADCPDEANRRDIEGAAVFVAPLTSVLGIEFNSLMMRVRCNKPYL